MRCESFNTGTSHETWLFLNYFIDTIHLLQEKHIKTIERNS